MLGYSFLTLDLSRLLKESQKNLKSIPKESQKHPKRISKASKKEIHQVDHKVERTRMEDGRSVIVVDMKDDVHMN